MKTNLRVFVGLALMALALVSCGKKVKAPSGLYRSTETSLGSEVEIDFQSGGTARILATRVRDSPGVAAYWRLDEQLIKLRIPEYDKDRPLWEKSEQAFKWDGDDLIVIGSNVRFEPVK